MTYSKVDELARAVMIARFFIFYFFRHKKAAEDLLSNRRGMGTCVRAYVLDTRAPVYGCVHMPKMCVIESRGECMSVRREE